MDSVLLTKKIKTMKNIINLRNLLAEQIKDLYSAELQQLKSLLELRAAATSSELKLAIDRHINETNEQVIRLDSVFESLNVEASAEKSKGMQALIEQARELCDRCVDPEVTDAAIITAIQHINHYEIAGYGTASAYADAIGAKEAATMLHATLEEEKSIDEELSKLAEESVNARAKVRIF